MRTWKKAVRHRSQGDENKRDFYIMHGRKGTPQELLQFYIDNNNVPIQRSVEDVATAQRVQ